MRKLFTAMVVFAAALAFTSVDASAFKINDDHAIYGYGQVWAVIHEDADSQKDADVRTTKAALAEEASESTFGFHVKRLRFGIKGDVADGVAYYNLFADGVSGNVKLLDYWFGLNFLDGKLRVQLGQFRPFVTWEGGIEGSSGLKNLDRSIGVQRVNTQFYIADMAWRDRGLLISYGDMNKDLIAVSVSATNGTGAGDSANVGGDVKSGPVKSNDFGNAAYVIGVASNPLGDMLRVQASYGINYHDGAVAGGNAVYVNRMSASAGFMLKLLDGALWLDGEYAGLFINEDDTHYGKNGILATYDTYNTFYVRAGYYILPKQLELVGRYGMGFETPWDDSLDTKQSLEASGTLNYYLGSAFKAQLDYTYVDADTDDDADTTDSYSVRLGFQAKF